MAECKENRRLTEAEKMKNKSQFVYGVRQAAQIGVLRREIGRRIGASPAMMYYFTERGGGISAARLQKLRDALSEIAQQLYDLASKL